MSSRFGGGAKCPKCGKTVYMAEEIVGAGSKWHKMCFKCTDCNKMLDSTTVAENDGNLYCKSCHSRQFGLKGYGYGQGAGTLASEAGSHKRPSPTTAPAVESTDFATGSASGHSMGSTGYASYGVEKGTAKPSSGSASRFGGSDKCGRCGKSVYAAEKIIGAGQSWHKACFNCVTCNKKLDSTTVADKDGEIFCKACYGKKFGPKGVGFGLGAGTLTTS